MDIYKQKPHLLSSVYSVASVFILPFFITDIYSITGFSFNTITPWIETVRFIHIALTIGLFLNLYSRKETYIDPRALNFLIGFALLWVYMYFMNYFITWYNAPAVNEYLSIKSISIIMSLFFPLVLIFYRKNAFAKVIMVLILISHLVTLMG
jgi:hypothetical protein